MSLLMTWVTQETYSSTRPRVYTASTLGWGSGRQAQCSLLIKPLSHIQASNEMPIPMGHKEKGKTRPGSFSKTTVFKGDDVPTGLSGLGAGKPVLMAQRCSPGFGVCSYHSWPFALKALAFVNQSPSQTSFLSALRPERGPINSCLGCRFLFWFVSTGRGGFEKVKSNTEESGKRQMVF